MPREGSEGTKRLQRVVPQGAAQPALLLSSCTPQLPGKPLGQGAVRAAEKVALQEAGGHKPVYGKVCFPRKLTACKESQVK